MMIDPSTLPHWEIIRTVTIGPHKDVTLTMTPRILCHWQQSAGADFRSSPLPVLLKSITSCADLIVALAKPTHPHLTQEAVLDNLDPDLARTVRDMFREAQHVHAAATAQN